MFAKRLNSLMFLLKNAFFWAKYKILSNSLHGTHSPFVYKLLEEVVYDYSQFEEYHTVENLRKSYKNSTEKITMMDFGAGSSKNNNKILKVSFIASNFLNKKKYSQLLFRLIRKFKPESIIELGTSLGVTTAYLAIANQNSKVISMEACPNTSAFAKKGFYQLGLNNIEVVEGNLDITFPALINKLNEVDFIFFNANHRKEATLNYFNIALEKAHKNTIFIFDDIYWSKGMMETWAEIKNNPQVKVTIDLFEIGIVLFREEQEKENFIINY